MKRFFLAACLFFNAAGQLLAATVDLYVDNRVVATGLAQVSGSSSTLLKVGSFSAFDTSIAATHADLQYMGLNFTAGTGAPAATTTFKITAVDTTDPDHPVLTVNSMSITPAADWAFSISYGSNSNTGASQTKGSSTTGPTRTIRPAMSSTALATDDTGHVHIRGGTGSTYDSTHENSGIDQIYYTNSVNAAKSYILEGYYQTASPCDLTPTFVSTYQTVSASNPARAVLVSAGELLAATHTNFPVVSHSSANASVTINNPTATTPSITFRNLEITHASTSGTSSVIIYAPTTTSPSVAFEWCVLGSNSASHDNVSVFTQGGTPSTAPTANITFSKCAILSRRSGIYVTRADQFTVDQCYFNCVGLNNAGSAVAGIAGVQLDNSAAATYDASLNPMNQVLRTTITDNVINHAATSSGSTTSIGVWVRSNSHGTKCKVSGNYMTLYSQASGVTLGGNSALDIQNNRIIIDNATAHGVGIAVGADAAVEANPTGDGLILITSGNTDATSSNVAADGSTPLALPAHTTFKLTGGSATNDLYNGLLVRKSATATGPQWSAIWDYDGTSKLAKCTPQFTNAAVGNEQWAVYRLRQQSHGVIAHNFVNSVTLPTTSSHAFGIFQGADHIDFIDNTAIGYFDNGIVLKGEYNRVNNNRVAGGKGCLLIKGGSWNEITHNTFYQNNARSAGGCFQWNDKSNVHNMASGEAPLSASHWSKTCGNRVTDNIFINAATVDAQVIDDNSIGAGSWLGAASAYPMGQGNVVDYNVYCQLHATANVGNLGGNTLPSGTIISDLWNLWAAEGYAIQYGATNDRNSSVGTITLRSPTTGDFTVIGGTAKSTAGSDGQPVGASGVKTRFIYVPQ